MRRSFSFWYYEYMSKTKIIVLSITGGVILIAGIIGLVVAGSNAGIFGKNKTALVRQYRAEHAEDYTQDQTVSIGQVDIKVTSVLPYELKPDDSFGDEVANTKYIAVTVAMRPNDDAKADELFSESEMKDALGVGRGLGPKIPWGARESTFDRTWALNQEALGDTFRDKSVTAEPAEVTYVFRVPVDLEDIQLVYTLSTFEIINPIVGTEGAPMVTFVFRINL